MINWESILTSVILALVMWLAGNLAGWIKEQRKRYNTLEERLDILLDAQQATMRTNLVHYSEKYIERGWITPEERASWCDMHDKYARLGANGLIDGYRRRLDNLEDREILT